MKVRLANCGNPDHGQNPNEPVWGCPHASFPVVGTLEEARRVCLRYIAKWELGGSQWAGGQVYDGHGNQIANISYNGRVWDMDDKEIRRLK